MELTKNEAKFLSLILERKVIFYKIFSLPNILRVPGVKIFLKKIIIHEISDRAKFLRGSYISKIRLIGSSWLFRAIVQPLQPVSARRV